MKLHVHTLIGVCNVEVYSDETTAKYGAVNSDVSVGEQSVLSVIEVGMALSAVKFRNSKLGKWLFGEPIEPISGDYYSRRVDLDYPGVLPLQLVRTYPGKDRVEGLLGSKWICSWSPRLQFGQEKGEGTAILEDADGQHLQFALGYGAEFTARHLKAPNYHLTGNRQQACLFDSRTQQTLVFVPEMDGSDTARLSSIEDRNGNHIDFRYEGGHLRQVVHSDGTVFLVSTTMEGFIRTVTMEGESEPCVRYAYDGKGELTDVYSRSHGEFHFTYTREGWLNHWHDSGVTQVELDYDQSGRVIATRTPEGLYNDRFEYFPAERKSVFIDALGARTTLWYDERELLLKREDPLGNIVTHEWDGFERKVSTTDPLGRVTRYEYTPLGRLIAEIDWTGRTTRYQYDKQGLLTQVGLPDGRKVTWKYDKRGNLIAAAALNGTTTLFRYDEHGRRTAATGPDGATTRWEYDQRGCLTGWRNPLDQATAVELDAWGRLRQVTDPEGRTTQYRFDAGLTNPRGDLSSVCAPDGGEERFAYDSEGQLAAQTGPEGQMTRFSCGAFDLLRSITDPKGYVTELAYDGAARLTSITNAAGRRWIYSYDGAGNLEAETDWAGRKTTYHRDALGRVVRKHLPDGIVQSISWDDRDRIVSVDCPTGRIAYEYDESDRLIRAATFANSGEHETELLFTYDDNGRLLEENQNGVPIRYAYDAAGRCISRSSPSGESQLAFDPCGRLQTFTSNGHSLSFKRNAAGQETIRQTGPNAFSLRQSYDPCGRLWAQSADRSRDNMVPAPETPGEIHRQYNWDRSGRLVGVADSLRGMSGYAYDPRDQVTFVQRNGNRSNEHYDYNALMDLARSDGRRHDYQNGEVQRVGDSKYRRDARGRVIGRTVVKSGFRPESWTYRWDDFDHLVEANTSKGGTWRYTYDAFGRRVKKEDLTKGKQRVTRYLWQGANLVEEIQDQAEISIIYRWHFEPGTFSPIAKEVVSGSSEKTFFPIVTDHLGTPKELFNEDGECLWQADHSLWGKASTLLTHGDVACNLRFQNQWEDEETGLYYNLNRYYDPESGQYLSQDPIKLAGGLRTHGYVQNPTVWTDPWGLESGTGILHYYSPESLGQRSPHFSIETIGPEALHTHQVITSPTTRNTTMIPAEGLPKPTQSIPIDIPDINEAQQLQRERLYVNLGEYNIRNNSCLTNAADVLRAGKADVPSSNLKLRVWLKSLIGGCP